MKQAIILSIASICLSAQTPTLPSFIAGANVAFRSINSDLANSPQPKVPFLAQLPASYLTQGNAVVTNTLDVFLNDAGITEVSLYPDIIIFACDSHYTGAIVVGDCTAFNTYLATLDTVFTHALANGQHMYGGFTLPSATLASLCGWVIPPATPPYTMPSAATYETCVKPLLVAAIQRYGSAAVPAIGGGWQDFQILEEPTTTTFTLGIPKCVGAEPNSCSTNGWAIADVDTLLTHENTAIKAAVPTIKTAATIAGNISCAIGGCDISYFIHWITSMVGVVDRFYMDVFNSTCNILAYKADLDSYAALADLAYAAGWTLGIGQMSPPRWCQAGSGNPTEGGAFQGNGFTGIVNVYMQWAPTIQRWMGVHHFVIGGTIFCAPPLWYLNDTVNKCSTGTYTLDSIAHLGQTTWSPIGSLIQSLNAGYSLSIQGATSITSGKFVRQ